MTLRNFILSAFVLVLLGCQSIHPIDPSTLDDPCLVQIHESLQDAVRAAHEDPRYSWNSGWMGNIWVNIGGETQVGLCHHWQEWVYREVITSVRQVGWDACSIAINTGTDNEHHPVVVYDPQHIDQHELITSVDPSRAYVLDAWPRGQADIFDLKDWLQRPIIVWTPAKLEDLSDG